MQIDQPQSTEHTWMDRSIFSMLRLNLETGFFLLIIVLAFFTRFYDLESRVMSHDETSHVYFSWLLYRGQGYAHDPVTHGPFQFHIVALSYFLFGDNDLTARIPAALFSVATIAFAWVYRRYLGRYGTMVAALLLLISPFLLYYGRYVRNEAFVGLYFMVNLWAILRYLETGKRQYMLWLTISMALHFATKETSFIYAAQALLFLGIYFLYRITSAPWERPHYRNIFILALMVGFILFAGGFALLTLTGAPVPAEAVDIPAAPQPPNYLAIVLISVSGLAIAVGLFFLVSGYGAQALRQERSFNMMLVLFTLILPQLSPFAMNLLRIAVPVNATQVNALQPTNLIQMGVVILVFILVAVLVGLWWNPRQWLINAGIFYGIFVVLYTTFFTNGAGLFTGLVGSLGYWLAQQEVERGSQPFYYYLLLQIPIYEYLPALGVWLAVVLRIAVANYSTRLSDNLADQEGSPSSDPESVQPAPVFFLLFFWTISSALAFSIAGEKMPWLTFHITLPMILLSAWGIGKLIESTDWSHFREQHGWLVLVILPVFISAIAVAAGSLFSATPPFQGQSLEQLSITSTFVTALAAAIGSSLVLAYWMRTWPTGQILRILTLFILALLGILTGRTAARASYINYDNATEYLVYAHSAPGVKIALHEIEDISRRLTGTTDIVVAYDNDTSYPYWWYLRNFSQQRFYGGNPTRDLRDAPLILVGDANYARLEPILGNSYYQFDYIRIWWPNQDYFDLTWERLLNAIRDPQLRQAIFKVWLNRDFTEYAQVTGKDLKLSNWYPAGRMRLYVRKDVANQLWQYGTTAEVTIEADPYEGKQVSLIADLTLGNEGSLPGQFKKPRGVAVAPDGSLYIADTENHRIQHLSQDGTVLQVWGTFADAAQGTALGGTFNEPWGIAVAPDGSVYVADTWNHRIQKFTADGVFVSMWGTFGQAETPQSYWGPRGVAVDALGHVYVTDTGNKRIVIFDAEGNFLTEFGLSGSLPGEFNEPVGVAVAPNGTIYVTDTWNQRVQVIALDQSGTYQPLREWEIVGWYGQSLDNKPYITVDEQNHVYTSDPESYRIVEFTSEGELVRYWGEFGSGLTGLNLPIGLAVEPGAGIWVADSGNHRILRYPLP